MTGKKKFRYSDYKLWAQQARAFQEQKKKYLTCAEAAKVFGLYSRSAAQERLNFLVEKGLAERIFEGKWHYHIYPEVAK